MKKRIFTVIFMVIITVIFISVLAVVNEISRSQIEKNARIQNIRSILYAFNMFPEGFTEKELSLTNTANDVPWEEKEILRIMNEQIKIVRVPVTKIQKDLLKKSFLSLQDSVNIFVLLDENKNIESYGFFLKGKGLWGTISAFGVVSADLKIMIGIDFTENIETPGLGARITEKEFKYYFRNLDLSGFWKKEKDKPAVSMVNKKEKTNIEQSTDCIQAITGATQTCNGVLDMINTDLGFYLAVIKQNKGILEGEVGERLNSE